jgi:hypothetical protein
MLQKQQDVTEITMIPMIIAIGGISNVLIVENVGENLNERSQTRNIRCNGSN